VGLFARGQWPSLAAAPLGAAAALGRLLALDEERLTQALAMAALQSVRTPGRSLSDTPARWLLFGQAVRSGCLSALAAAQGVQADVAAAEAALTLNETTVPGATRLALADTSLKPHPGAKQAMAALAALRQLLQEVADVRAIERIEVFVPAAYAAMLQREPPQASRLARLVHGPWQLALQCCAPERLFDAARLPLEPGLALQVQALAERIHIAHEPALEAHYPHHWPARVRLDEGHRGRERILLDSDGDPGTGVDAAWLLDKAQRVLGPGPELARVHAALEGQWDEAVGVDGTD
jgi:2-methylcitrate dehydratase PrpD